MKYIYFMVSVFIACFSSFSFIYAQTTSVIGRVVMNDSVSGLEMVSVNFLEHDRIVITDPNGRFRVRLPFRTTYKAQISRIGYKSRSLDLKAFEGKLADIVMIAEENLLEEVVVNTGYQTLPKERATGSFEVVGEKLFNRQIGTDVISRLDGIMPSILFDKRNGSERNMIIRGESSLGGATDSRALIVVDNFPFEGDINSINPNDVESVTLLKDAAAASIWGARAGNGVLVITTKKGRFDAPWKLSLTSNSSFLEKPNLYYVPRMSSKEFIEAERFLYDRGVFNAALNNVTSRPPLTPAVELLHQHANGEISSNELESALAAMGEIDIRSDLSKYFNRVGHNQQYAFTITGGGKRYSSLFSGGYDNNRSTQVGNGFRRISFNLQNTYKLTSVLDANIGVRYGISHTLANQKGNVEFSSSKNIYPYADLVDDFGNPLVVTRDYRASYLDLVDQRGNMLDWRYRPYDELYLADNTTRNNNLLFAAGFTYRLSSGLRAEVSYQYETQMTKIRELYGEQTYYTRNLINRFTQITAGTLTRAIPNGAILDRSDSQLEAHSVRGQIGYDKVWDQHSIAMLVGSEIRDTRVTGNSGRQYGYNDELLTFSPVDYVTRHSIYDNLAGATPISFLDRGSGSTQRFVSMYFNGTYNYLKKYTVSLSARRDASNLFGVSTNNKWSPLWSVGAAWDLADEDFYHFDFLPKLKLRATYGYSGNIRRDVAAITTLQYFGLSRLGRFPYAVVQNPPNSELRWEKIGTLNLGLDFGMRGSRFNGSMEYYDKKAIDLISSVDSDPTTGFSYLTMNSAVIRNRGIDVTLNTNIPMGRVNYLGTFLLSRNTNRILEYFREPTRFSQWVGSGGSISPIVGQPAYPLVSYRWGGLDPQTGDPIGYLRGEESRDYNIMIQQATQEDLVFHGSAIPEYFGSFRNTVEYRGLSLSVNITYRAAYYFRRQTVNYSHLLSLNGQAVHGDFAARWQQPGDEEFTTIPSMIYPVNSRRDDFYRDSEATVERGDHVRLHDVNLSYSIFPNPSFPLRELKLTGYVRNLGILWASNGKGLDPDVNQLPLPKTFAIGLTANF